MIPFVNLGVIHETSMAVELREEEVTFLGALGAEGGREGGRE